MGQRVDLSNHGDDSSVRRQLEQGHQEAGSRGSAAANSGIRSIGETELEAKLEEAVSKIKRDRYSIRCIFVLVTYLDGVMIS